MRKAGVVAMVLICGFLIRATSARADDAEGQRSAALFREGVAAGKAGDYARAEAAFRTAYLLTPTGATLRNWALAEMKLGKFAEALKHLRSAAGHSGLSAEQRAVVQQNLDDAYAATGHIALTTNDGARVTIDGAAVDGSAPFGAPLDVASGTRHVEARVGARFARADVDALPGQVVEVNVPIASDLPPVPPTPQPAPPPRAAVPSVRQEPEARSTWWTAPHAFGLGLAAVSAAGLVLGVSFDLASQSAGSNANALRTSLGGTCTGAALSAQCTALRDQIDTVHQEEAAKWAGYAAGAAAGVGSVVLLVVGGRGEPAARTGSMRLAPLVTPGALGVEGTF